MESFEGIIDFSREEELTLSEEDKLADAFRSGKKLKGKISCLADGNFVQFDLETEESQVVKFVMNFNSLMGLCQDVGFDMPISNKQPSEKEKKQIEEDAKHDGYKKYLEESKEDIIN